MKSSMEYRTNVYGNTGNAPSYTVKLSRAVSKGAITITSCFDSPAEGRGVGASRGDVEQVRLELPRKTAQALSHALQLALSDTKSTDLQFQIDKTAVAADPDN